jgi:hypothetical protein
MSNIKVHIIGPEKPCSKCMKTRKNLEKMIQDFPDLFDNINISHLEISSREVIEKYGILQSPAVAINGVLINQGHVPTIKKLKTQFQQVINL